MDMQKTALVMSNARRLIKTKKKTCNARLYSELFGAGNGTAIKVCRELGLDPDGNKTCYTIMANHLSRKMP